jgi:hypothetical protein
MFLCEVPGALEASNWAATWNALAECFILLPRAITGSRNSHPSQTRRTPKEGNSVKQEW